MTINSTISFNDVGLMAKGNWDSILASLNIDIKRNKHTACPSCGGKDRFRFDDKDGRGTYYCNSCGAGDGFKLVQNYLGTDTKGALKVVAEVLGVQGGSINKQSLQLARAKAEEHKAHQKALEERQREKAAAKATSIIESPETNSFVNTEHPYLVSKGIQPHDIYQHKDMLIIPLFNNTGLVNLQFIKPDGTKRFLKGGKKKGCCYLIGEPTETILFTEGFATGASLHEATGLLTTVCFDAGNIIPVMAALKANQKAVVCADHDDAGIKAATMAGLNFGCRAVAPDEQGYDFNDLSLAKGKHSITTILRGLI